MIAGVHGIAPIGAHGALARIERARAARLHADPAPVTTTIAAPRMQERDDARATQYATNIWEICSDCTRAEDLFSAEEFMN
eukprot:3327741-Pleurochrysis_carterae.AAC.4